MNYQNDQLIELLGGLCNGTLTPEQQLELEQILLKDEGARQLYHDYLDVHLAIVDRGLRNSALSDDADLLSAIGTDSPATGSAIPGTFPVRSIGKWLAGVAALALVCFSVYWAISSKKIEQQAGRGADDRSANTIDEVDDSSALYVAQLVSLTPGIVLAKESSSPDFLLRARCGDRVKIESGLIELEYYSGANLILHGPCSFVFTGANSGRLESGQVTGNVTGGDFFITTPTARVLDLGTEFGVSVDESRGTDVCVFDGEVQVFTESPDGSDSSMSLTEGMCARVSGDGVIDQKSPSILKQFTRQVPDQTAELDGQVSLVDLFSASAKHKHRLAGVIAPDTGLADQRPWLRVQGPGHRKSKIFRVTGWHSFVDGVFIPSASGKQVQITSAGTRIDLPPSKGRTWGPIWSRRKTDFEIADSSRDYWGTLTLEGVNKRLSECKTGMIGIHSNVGVTFDLDAIREQSLEPAELSFIVGNLDNSETTNPEWAAKNRFSADFRVFLDGKEVASRLDFTRADGEASLSIEIAEGQRFLTLVSSDGGHDGFDHVVVIDPVLKLKPVSGSN